MQNRLETIREKLFQLIEKDAGFKTFGSKEPWNGHEYILNPPLDETYVSAFENYTHTQLPKEYRQFILELADGNAGPYYGLYTLDEAAYNAALRKGIQESKVAGDWIDLFSKFPVSSSETASFIERLLELNTKQLSYFDGDDFQVGEFPLISLNGEFLRGVLYLAEFGCGGYYILVLKGDSCGQVWYSEEGKYLAPLCDSKGNIFSFFDWYEYWLDKSLLALEGL